MWVPGGPILILVGVRCFDVLLLGKRDTFEEGIIVEELLPLRPRNYGPLFHALLQAGLGESFPEPLGQRYLIGPLSASDLVLPGSVCPQ
jgi:hypothetical protein